ncbi:hypothetical protein J6TS7_06260 [Paenibacillus dendritiformis]|nr:hypothetical protein J6TS7_06260 [Paenibacillus dendritiformis]
MKEGYSQNKERGSNMFKGGKREGNKLYVKRGDKWIEILEAARLMEGDDK